MRCEKNTCLPAERRPTHVGSYERSPEVPEGQPKIVIDESWDLINPNAAGIDLASREHWVAVPAGRDAVRVRRFGTFTADLEAMADWLQACGVTSSISSAALSRDAATGGGIPLAL